MSRCASALTLEIMERCGPSFETIEIIDNADIRIGRRSLQAEAGEASVVLYESVSLIRRDCASLRADCLRSDGELGGPLFAM